MREITGEIPVPIMGLLASCLEYSIYGNGSGPSMALYLVKGEERILAGGKADLFYQLVGEHLANVCAVRHCAEVVAHLVEAYSIHIPEGVKVTLVPRIDGPIDLVIIRPEQSYIMPVGHWALELALVPEVESFLFPRRVVAKMIVLALDPIRGKSPSWHYSDWDTFNADE
jgi:hypothetical protein